MDWVAKLCFLLIFMRSQATAFWLAEASPWLASLPTSFMGFITPGSNVVLQDNNDALLTSGGLYRNWTNTWVLDDVTLTKLDPSTGQVIKQCRLPSLPHPRAGHTMDSDMVCGGSKLSGWDGDDWKNRLTDCISLTQGRLKTKLNNWWKGKSWTKTYAISQRRKHMSWNSPEGVVLMGGEMDSEIARIWPNIKELSDIPELPDAIIPFYGDEHDYTRYGPFELETTKEHGCTIPDVGQESVIITGAGKNQGRMDRVLRYGLRGFIEELPHLLNPRKGHACAGYHKQENYILLVAGGSGSSEYMTSTEIYQGGKWQEVGPLPNPLRDHRAATLSNAVFISGGDRASTDDGITHDILWFDSDSETWTKTGEMMIERMEHGLSAVKWDQFSDSCVEESQIEALSPKQKFNDFLSPDWAHEPNDAIIISGSIPEHNASSMSSVSLLELDPLSGAVINSCSLPEMPGPPRYGHSMNGDLACGGSPGDFKKLGECISLSGGTIMNRLKSWWKGEFWPRTHRYLAHARYDHVSWKVPGGVVLMGGAGGWRSAELVSDDGTAEDLFGFNFDLMDACGIPDEKTKSVIITGGYKSQFQVMRYNLKGFMEEIRPMLTGRSSHGCAGYNQDEKLVLLVTGGFSANYEYLASTEIYQDGLWREVGALPVPLLRLKGASLDNTVFMTGGQEENVGDRSDILKFDPSTEAWTRSGEMRVKRSDHTISEVKWRDYSEYCI